MNTTQSADWKTVNTTDIRFRFGSILEELQKGNSPILVISRSKPKAWLYPYESGQNAKDLFARWQRHILPKYQKVKAKDFINLIRKDRDSRTR